MGLALLNRLRRLDADLQESGALAAGTPAATDENRNDTPCTVRNRPPRRRLPAPLAEIDAEPTPAPDDARETVACPDDGPLSAGAHATSAVAVAQGPSVDVVVAGPGEPGRLAEAPLFQGIEPMDAAAAGEQADLALAARAQLFGTPAAGANGGASGSASAFAHLPLSDYFSLQTSIDHAVEQVQADLPADATEAEWEAATRRAREAAKKVVGRAFRAQLEARRNAVVAALPDANGAPAGEPSFAQMLKQLGPRVPRTPEQRRQDARDRIDARRVLGWTEATRIEQFEGMAGLRAALAARRT